MIYELRRYQLTSPPMKAVFNDHMASMMPMFDDCDMSVVGAWDGLISTTLPFHTYMLRWRDLAHRQESWDAFYGDPAFWRARDSMNERGGGQVVAQHSIEILTPGTYSPLDRGTDG